MDTIFIYLIKSSLSLIVLYLSYELFFRKEAYFKFSRALLLSSVSLVILLPLFPYSAIQLASVAFHNLTDFLNYSKIASYTLEEIVINATASPSIFMNEISLGSLLLIIYITGVIVQIVRFFLRILQLSALINKSEKINIEGLTFVFTSKGTPTFSFLNWIFIDPDLLNKEADFQTILSHEKIHAQQGHSYDLILAEILIMIQWFNPFAYMLRNSIKENHEYIADHEVMSNINNKHSYQLILLQHSSRVKTNILAHNFSYSLLKRRLHIMKKTKNPFAFSLRIALLNASLILIIFACSSPQEKQTKASDDPNAKTEKASEVIAQEPVFMVVEVMPEYPGGNQALIKFIGENISYPEAAKKAGITGRVLISFIIEKDGSVTNAYVKEGIGNGCDEEAIRVVNSMPKWTPGKQRGEAVRVAYDLPIKFNLQ